MSSRRQYSSCDPCRRLKRKCVYNETARRPGLACLRCNELGYNCTFNYVSTRIEQKRRKRTALAADYRQCPTGSTEVSSIGESFEDVAPVDWNSIFQPYNSDASLGLNDLNASIVTEFLNLETLGETWQDLTSLDLAQPPILDTNTTSSDDALQIDVLQHDYSPGTQFERAQSFNSWKGGPTQLLNSTFTAKSLGTCLYRTYAAMMHGMESRYLEHECNPFGTSHRYTFDLENPSLAEGDSRPSKEPSDCKRATSPLMGMLQNLAAVRHPCQGRSPPDLGDPIKITFVGLVKFLDHFGPFYGNRLGRRSKVEDERMLIAAQQVFALQWAASSSHENNNSLLVIQQARDSSSHDRHAFASSWFKARSLILNATPGYSFTRVYAMILFHMSVTPEEAKDVAGELNGILDQSLRQFDHLRNMLDEYVKLLSDSSNCRSLLQSSIKALEWFAYIKDTFIALLNDRDCILNEAPLDLSVTELRSNSQPVDNFVDADVPLICQRAVLFIYPILRQTAKVKKILRDTETIAESSHLVSALDSAISFVEAFNHKYEGFRDRCMAGFETLSSTSKLSFGYLVLFRCFGILTLAEQIARWRNNSPRQESNFTELAKDKAEQYETAAISSVIAISKHIATMSTVDASISISGDSGLKLPFILHHASLAPIVAVLNKTIDHIIQRIVKSETTEEKIRWMLSIKPVLTCLLDMKQTMAGSRSIEFPLNTLLGVHGDLLMECWTTDDID